MPTMADSSWTTQTRRDFLKASAALGGAAAAGSVLSGCSSIEAVDPTVQTEEKVFNTYCNACMGCPLEAVVRNDNVVLTRAKEIITPDGRDLKRMCARGASIPTLLVQPKRIKYPMKRVEGTERGAGQWERISWEEAIDTICKKIVEYQSEFGPSSVCTFTFGTTEPRNLWNLYRLENYAQFSHQNRTTDMALSGSLYYTVGGYFYQQCDNSELISNMKTFVVWGHNPIVSWPNTWHYIADAIENHGCKLIVVDPIKNTIGHKADLFVSVRPGTDGALALGMANYMDKHQLIAEEYVKTRSAAPFLVKAADGMYLRKSDLEEIPEGGSDDYVVWDEAADAWAYASVAVNPSLRRGTFEVEGLQVNTSYDLLMDLCEEYPLDRVAELTTVPEETILEFIRLITENSPCDIHQGYGPDHYGNGFNTLSAISVLRILGGMVPDPVFPYSLNNTGFAAAETEHPVTSAQIDTFMLHDIFDNGYWKQPDQIMKTAMGDIELPGTVVEAPLKMLMSFGGNIINSSPNRARTIAAYKKFEFMVAINVEWCDTADIADIVLPAAMIQESIGTISINETLIRSDQAITPRFEAKPDFEIAKLIAEGIGLGEYFTDDMETAMAKTVNESSLPYFGVTYDVLKEAGVLHMGYMPLPAPVTNTGRLQFYHEYTGPFDYFGQSIDPTYERLPYWRPPIEAWPETVGGFEANPLAEKYPMTLVCGTRRFRVHSYYGQNPLLREMEINEPCVRINPEDAAARGVEDGDYVKLFNDRGHAVARATLSAGIRPGCLDLDRGWQGSQYISGCSQDLTHTEIVDWACPNYAYHDVLCQFEKWDGKVE